MSDYPVENLLREPTEIYTAVSCLALATLAVYKPHYFLLTKTMGYYAGTSLAMLASLRFYQVFKIKTYHRKLLAMPFYQLACNQIPVSPNWLFVGRGFRWLPHHTQRLHQIKQVKNEKFMQRPRWYQRVRSFCQKSEHSRLTSWFNNPSKLNPFRPDPPVGGSPLLHGLGDADNPVYIPQNVRGGHTLVVGTTQVGKTRLSSILINQDIRNGDAVIVVDPKGDLALMQDMAAACEAAGRMDDFSIVHLGFPKISAKYNPLKNYEQISEVATRLTDAVPAEGEGKQFAAFAWKYVNIVATCLEEMNLPITYKSIDFYKGRLDQLMMAYADKVFPKTDSQYHQTVEQIIADHNSKIGKNNKTKLPMERPQAVIEYVKRHIQNTVENGKADSLQDQIFIDLFDAAVMDKQYYDKITASIGPVLSEINKSNASSLFSFDQSENEIELMQVIKQKKVVYLGLDSMTNANIAQAVGKAFLSDLVSTAGKLYKEEKAGYKLNLHCDELSEIIQDSFVKILNKAGGAGFRVTAYTQTIQDMEVALGSKARAQMSEGNFNTLIMLRPKNEETANLLVKVLPQVGVVGHTEISMVNDTPHGADGVYFNTTNEDRVQTTSVPMIDVHDIISLPKGQAFVLVNGGELWKVRLPMPVADRFSGMGFEGVIGVVNG